MKEGSNFNNSIIVRFLMKEASESDILLLEGWITSDVDNKNYFDQIRNTWNSIELDKELDDLKIEKDFNRIQETIQESKYRYTKSRRWPFLTENNWILKAVAIFFIGSGFSWFVFQKPFSQDANSIVYNTIETPRGSRATIKLPDGSKVLLNAESKLIYPQQFTLEKREILLEGEAFFEIEKDPDREFLVKTPDLTVKVFGTRFNVKSYPGENTTETTLVEGSISVYKNSMNGKMNGKEIKMNPNERLVLYKDQEKSTLSESQVRKMQNLPERKPKLVLSKRIDTGRFTSWKDGQLKIKSEPMKKLAVILERRYDVKIYFEDEEIKLFKFTGTFKNETIEQVLAAMELASPINYRIEEREIWIGKNERAIK